MTQPTHLSTLADLDAAIAASAHQPLLLFKHSAYCDRSHVAYREFLAFCREAGDVGTAVVTVQTHRAISDEMERRLGVLHETPQVLLVRDGAVCWHAHHRRVSAQAIRDALDQVAAQS